MRKLGKKRLPISLQAPLQSLPRGWGAYALALTDDGTTLLMPRARKRVLPYCCASWQARWAFTICDSSCACEEDRLTTGSHVFLRALDGCLPA